MDNLTKQQSKVLNVIKRFIKKNKYPPTHMEISDEMGFKSPNGATEHIAALERKGKIKRVPGLSRGLVVIDD